MDVKIAFLNGKIEEEVYIEHPEGFETFDRESHVCRLKRTLYGLRQAPLFGLQNVIQISLITIHFSPMLPLYHSLFTTLSLHFPYYSPLMGLIYIFQILFIFEHF